MKDKNYRFLTEFVPDNIGRRSFVTLETLWGVLKWWKEEVMPLEKFVERSKKCKHVFCCRGIRGYYAVNTDYFFFPILFFPNSFNYY